MSYMFYGCKSLSSLPDISKWNTNNINNIWSMINRDSKWNTNNVAIMNGMLSECPNIIVSKVVKAKFNI